MTASEDEAKRETAEKFPRYLEMLEQFKERSPRKVTLQRIVEVCKELYPDLSVSDGYISKVLRGIYVPADDRINHAIGVAYGVRNPELHDFRMAAAAPRLPECVLAEFRYVAYAVQPMYKAICDHEEVANIRAQSPPVLGDMGPPLNAGQTSLDLAALSLMHRILHLFGLAGVPPFEKTQDADDAVINLSPLVSQPEPKLPPTPEDIVAAIVEYTGAPGDMVNSWVSTVLPALKNTGTLLRRGVPQEAFREGARLAPVGNEPGHVVVEGPDCKAHAALPDGAPPLATDKKEGGGESDA